ncbi:PF06296 domain protein, partial [Leptospira interrogans str. 2003000735]|uniref:PF06296 domain protein n=8 Tax=Leptospira interrogans TaxID=173 RepID=A0A0E2DAC5_LEPIR|nr:type II toxin-antitoxin system RelE/ParE family toxin [Leptospira interrogans]EMN29968.1 PF06296 domain protein [Leptospira interrogans serovar Pyrogenes str. L0374]EMY06418.1 PF06296 domain protein [Leptospira interrogans str. 2002000626]EMY22814.1 PF06296 domain protein [Leptospira interrogans serovar Australis str. 200703203]EKN87848.1 PF06296 domain protein [Leptospira interrogans str. 2002000624]EKQ37668.1 PF06296 domain protein [Leptospira interrogans str. 2002000621]
MNFNILRSLQFEKELKRLIKKYPSLKKEYENLISSLEKNPTEGTPIGQNCYKIRIPIASKGKGKSGGARVISCVVFVEKTVFLVSIYDKSEKENISDKDLEKIIKNL